MSKFSEFEMTLLEASAPLASVIFGEDVCDVRWEFVADYTSSISIKINDENDFKVAITEPDGKLVGSVEHVTLASIIKLLRELDTSILNILVEDDEENDEKEQEFLS